MIRAVAFLLLSGLAMGCNKNSPMSTTGVMETSQTAVIRNQSASERLRTVTWVYTGKDGATQRLMFGADGKVAVSESHPTLGSKASSFLYRIVNEDGEQLTLHIADDAGASVSGVKAIVGERLEFPTGGAFGINGVYNAH